MERLTFAGNFCDIAQCREMPCQHGNNCSQKQIWERLKAYEDTGLTPEEIKKIGMEVEAVWHCKKAGVHEPIDHPVEVKCLFYMPTKRRVDLTNLLEAVDDVLVKARVLLDDHCGIIVSHDGSRVLYDKENPRTEVCITAYE